MESQDQKVALAAKNWRETERKMIAAKSDPLLYPKLAGDHNRAKQLLRTAVDELISAGTPP